MTLCKFKITFSIEFLKKRLTLNYSMIVTHVFEMIFEGIKVDIKLKVFDDRRNRWMIRIVILSDVKDDLTFITVCWLQWATGSYLVERYVIFFKVFKSAFRNINNLSNLSEGMSSTLNQSKGSTSSFGHPLDYSHDVFQQLSKNWSSIYYGSGSGMTQISDGILKFSNHFITFCKALYLPFCSWALVTSPLTHNIIGGLTI